jgi:hypothetical protein
VDNQCQKKPFFTKRVLLSILGLVVATGLVCAGKISGGEWVYALAVVVAGHHAADIVSAWKGK